MQLKSTLFLAGLCLVVLGCDDSPVTGPIPSDDEIVAADRTAGSSAKGGPGAGGPGGAPPTAPAAPKAPEFDFGATTPVFKKDNVYLAGQPEEGDFKKIAEAGVTRVISLCKDGEVSWDEKAAVEAAGMTFYHIPLASPEDMTNEALEKVRELLRESDNNPTLLHCKGAVRAKAAWIPYRAIDQKKGVRGAITELRDIKGLPETWLNPAAVYATNLEKNAKKEE